MLVLFAVAVADAIFFYPRAWAMAGLMGLAGVGAGVLWVLEDERMREMRE